MALAFKVSTFIYNNFSQAFEKQCWVVPSSIYIGVSLWGSRLPFALAEAEQNNKVVKKLFIDFVHFHRFMQPHKFNLSECKLASIHRQYLLYPLFSSWSFSKRIENGPLFSFYDYVIREVTNEMTFSLCEHVLPAAFPTIFSFHLKKSHYGEIFIIWLHITLFINTVWLHYHISTCFESKFLRLIMT